MNVSCYAFQRIGVPEISEWQRWPNGLKKSIQGQNWGATGDEKGTWLVFILLLTAFPCLYTHTPQTDYEAVEREGALCKKL